MEKCNVVQRHRKSKGGEAGVNVGDEIIAPYSQAWFC